MLTKSQMFRAELQRNRTKSDNLGVGDYDLIGRGYSQAWSQTVLRGSNAGAIGKTMYNELRAQWLDDQYVSTPTSAAPAVLVLNAFNTGGTTALHSAVQRGAEKVVRYLADHGAKLDMKNKQGRTPLDIAMGVGAATGRGAGGRGRDGAGRETMAELLRSLIARGPVPGAASQQ